MIKFHTKSKPKDRRETILIAALLLMIVFNVFDRYSGKLSTSHRKMAEADAEMKEHSNSSHSTDASLYLPSRLENRIMERSNSELQYNRFLADECDLFHNTGRPDFYQDYQDYLKMLDTYSEAVKNFDVNLDDIRLLPAEERNGICQSMDDVLKGAFEVDVALSRTREGYVEPLLPPLRHPRFCEAIHDIMNAKHLLDLNYLVHDFGLMCRQLDRNSKTVFVDMGASLEYHSEDNKVPSLQLVELYQKFGIQFDHYYAFEATVIPPDRVYKQVPQDILTSFHWFNVPVSVNETSKQNPWAAILQQFDESDLVVVKLDIDTATVEIPLVEQLLQEKNARIVDQFYFEHHVRMKYMVSYWQTSARGTLQQSLDLFTKLRKAGIAAHSWI